MISVAPRSRVAGWVVAAAATMLFALPLLAEDFYEQQLRAGKSDRAAGKLVEAADELRIAAFGFLDRPPLLADALVNLALAQSALGYAALPQTLDRFLEVERRFAAYVPAEIDRQTRTAFESLLLKSEPRSTLAAIPSLLPLTRSDAQKVSHLPVEKRAAAYEEGSRRAPSDVEWPLAAATDAANRGLDDDAIRWSRRALNVDKENDAARAVLAHALTRRSECREVLSQISRLSAEALKQHPELAGDQFVCLMAEKRWSDAETAVAKLPDAVRQRADVARAMQTLSSRKPAETQKADAPRTPATAMTSGSTEVARAPSPNPAPPTTQTQPVSQPAVQKQPANASRTAQALASSRSLVRAGRFGEAVQVLQPAVAADPSNRPLRLALLEAATLAHDWHTAIAQVSPTTPFAAGEEASMFYAAAALYENGRREEAQPLIERARPRLNSTAMIDYYYQVIVGGTSPK